MDEGNEAEHADAVDTTVMARVTENVGRAAETLGEALQETLGGINDALAEPVRCADVVLGVRHAVPCRWMWCDVCGTLGQTRQGMQRWMWQGRCGATSRPGHRQQRPLAGTRKMYDDNSFTRRVNTRMYLFHCHADCVRSYPVHHVSGAHRCTSHT